MTLGTFLQTIISIAFLYLILSIFTSELQEYLAAIFESRAKRLKQSIRQMLGEQDWPFYQLQFSDGLTIQNDSKIYIKDGKIHDFKEDQIIEDSGKFYFKGDAVTKYPVTPDGSNPPVYNWTKDTTSTQVKDITNLIDNNTAIWINNNDNTEVNDGQISPDSTTATTPTTGCIKGDAVTKVIVDISNCSVLSWTKDTNTNSIQVKSVANLTSDKKAIWINNNDNTEVKADQIIVTEVLNTNNNNPTTPPTGYIKGDAVIKYPVTLVNSWKKDTNSNPIPVKDVANLTSDQTAIWINHNANDMEVKKDHIIEVPNTNNNPTIPLGTGYIKGDPVTKYSVTLVNSWKKDTNSNPIPVKDVANLTSDQQHIWIKDKDPDNTEVKADQIIPNPPTSPTGYIKGEVVTQYQVKADIKTNSNYWLDVINKEIIDDKNKTIIDLVETDFQVDSLTEKFYNHRNIRALNQSSFGWWSFIKRGNKITLVCFFIAIGYLILSGLYLSSNQSWPFIISLILFGVVILGCILYYVKSENKSKKIRVEDKLGKMRKSVGPSYIDAEIFATTLIDVIRQNTDENLKDDKEARLNSLFYTPAKTILLEMLKKIKLEKDKDDLNTGELTEGLTERYKKGFTEVQERSSGVYKRNSKGLSFLLGLLIAVMFNADSLNMISSLTKENNNAANQLVTKLDENPDLFNCPVDGNQTECFDENKQEKLKEIFNSIDTFPLGWGIEQIDTTVADITKRTEMINKFTINECETETDNKLCFEAIEKLLTSENNMTEIVDSLSQPLEDSIKDVRNTPTGAIDESKLTAFKTQYTNFLNLQKKENISSVVTLINDTELTKQIKTTVEKQGGWAKVIFGWLITAVAIAMGAPFWFDLLGKVTNVRNAGKPISPEDQKPGG